MKVRKRNHFSVVALWLVNSVKRVKATNTIRLFSPAKVNLFLAVTGKRSDGFHDLISLVAPLSFGDTLSVSELEDGSAIEFSCTDPAVPVGPDNLVVKAAERFFETSGIRARVSIELEKRIPMEAGLGGGSSNAATALLALNTLFDHPLEFGKLSKLAADIGSDCPLFLHRAPVVMRGRGEQVEILDEKLVDALRGRTLAIFKPGIGISTAWAYGALAQRVENYSDGKAAEQRLAVWKAAPDRLDEILFNSFETPVFEKFVAFPVLFERIRNELKLEPLMSGSGASCMVFLPNPEMSKNLQTVVAEAFGEDCFFQICEIDTFK